MKQIIKHGYAFEQELPPFRIQSQGSIPVTFPALDIPSARSIAAFWTELDSPACR
jgi:hypothetical protein